MPDHGHYRQTRLEPPAQRLKRFFQRSGKRQRVYRVDIGDQSLKRIVFPDAVQARELAENLQAMRGRQVFPELVAQQGPDLWVEYLEGECITSFDTGGIAELARLYATLYSLGSELRSIEAGPWLADLDADLAFLERAGVLASAQTRGLRSRLVAWTPAHVWVGYDYSDPRPPNILVGRDGSYRFIDIESLSRNQLLGSGVAKACYRWLGDRRGELLAALHAHSCPPVLDVLPFVELVSLAGWTRRSVLLRKPKLVRSALFDQLLARG